MNKLLALHQQFSRFDAFLSDWGVSLVSLAIRCFVGWQFMKAGLVKVSDWDSTLALFHNEYHVPLLPPDLAAYMGAAGELTLPVLLFIGLLSRPAALALFFVNAMAVLSYPQLWMFDCPAAINDHLYWGALLLTVVAMGPGRLSADALFRRLQGQVGLARA